MNSSKKDIIGMLALFITSFAFIFTLIQYIQSNKDYEKNELRLSEMSTKLNQANVDRKELSNKIDELKKQNLQLEELNIELKEKMSTTNKKLTDLNKVSLQLKLELEAAQKKTGLKLSDIFDTSSDTNIGLYDFILEYESSKQRIENLTQENLKLKQTEQDKCDGYCDEKSDLYKELVRKIDTLKIDYKDKIEKLNGLVDKLNEEYDANRFNPGDSSRTIKKFTKNVHELFYEAILRKGKPSALPNSPAVFFQKQN